MPNLYRNEIETHPLSNAQRNLEGRTHYVDAGTLRFHKSRVLKAGAYCDGLVFAIITSDSLDWENTKRGYRYRIFDVFGTVICKQPIEQAWRTRRPCEKAMYAALDAIDARQVTLEAIVSAEKYHALEMDKLRAELDEIASKAA